VSSRHEGAVVAATSQKGEDRYKPRLRLAANRPPRHPARAPQEKRPSAEEPREDPRSARPGRCRYLAKNRKAGAKPPSENAQSERACQRRGTPSMIRSIRRPRARAYRRSAERRSSVFQMLRLRHGQPAEHPIRTRQTALNQAPRARQAAGAADKRRRSHQVQCATYPHELAMSSAPAENR